MNRTVIALFKSLEQARGAIREIGETKTANSEISVVLRKQPAVFDWETAAEMGGQPRPQPMDEFKGVLVAVDEVELPGLGAVAAGGPLAGALKREPDKGLAGNLVSYGLPPGRAADYEKQVGEGLVLTLIKTDNSKVGRVANFLSAFGGRDVEKWSKSIAHPLKPRK